jgi:hypothetical protein
MKHDEAVKLYESHSAGRCNCEYPTLCLFEVGYEKALDEVADLAARLDCHEGKLKVSA